MDIKILDSWLREFLETDAKPAEISKYLSLCGPSVEKVEKSGKDYIYEIEITTNRIDSVSNYGIAREASAILPRFGVKANLKKIKFQSKDYVFTKKVDYLEAQVDHNLCSRFTAVSIRNVKIDASPEIIKERLEKSGIRSINNVVDISNYIMLELGQPVHTFDYDKIMSAKMILRESKKGEQIQTLDDKKFTLPGGDIVIEDASGNLIDLAGVMGGKVSAVDDNTKNVLLFVQTYNPEKIRRTSMAISQRTMAAGIFEKGLDTELVAPAILRAIELFISLTGGKPESRILDIYPNPYKAKSVKISMDYINKTLGVEISKKDVGSFLSSLMFECSWSGKTLTAAVPSFRSSDIKNSEDLLEEIARIYGYHNLPNKIMGGELPARPVNPIFNFEEKLKNIISGFGGSEVYTLSLVPKKYTDEKALKLKNPLGPETEYLRTSLMPSLIFAAEGNVGLSEKFHLFEIANIYIPQNDNLPEEQMTLGGIFYGYTYRQAKGVIEATLDRLNIPVEFKSMESKGFNAGKCAYIYIKKDLIGKIGYSENDKFIYYEFFVQKLLEASSKTIAFRQISKYPSQVEDLTIQLLEHVKVGDVIRNILETDPNIEEVNYIGQYKNNHTFRIKYHNDKKTLVDEEVKDIRDKIIKSLKSKFTASIKE